MIRFLPLLFVLFYVMWFMFVIDFTVSSGIWSMYVFFIFIVIHGYFSGRYMIKILEKKILYDYGLIIVVLSYIPFLYLFYDSEKYFLYGTFFFLFSALYYNLFQKGIYPKLFIKNKTEANVIASVASFLTYVSLLLLAPFEREILIVSVLFFVIAHFYSLFIRPYHIRY